MDKIPSFWVWMFSSKRRPKPGFKSLVDKWLILHVFVGILSVLFIDQSLAESARSTIIPFASVLTGITFAWSGNITALLTTKEINKLAQYHEEGIVGYVFSVQRAIFLIFLTLVLWVLAGLDVVVGTFWKFVIFTVSSSAIRESWGVIMFAQMLTIYRDRMSRTRQK